MMVVVRIREVMVEVKISGCVYIRERGVVNNVHRSPDCLMALKLVLFSGLGITVGE